ncbi:class I SAM-dependent methyltransferase [Streptomyces rimosus]
MRTIRERYAADAADHARWTESNRALWDTWTEAHVRSDHYDVRGFLAGRESLQSFEPGELGPVAGRSLLHLQCHFGLDTLSWARRGAHVTGVDFSPAAVGQANAIAAKAGLPAEFVCAQLYDLPPRFDHAFDIVYVSFGSLVWLPDIGRWARAAARYLAPGGVLYVAEYHPMVHVLDFDEDADGPRLRYPYFHRTEPVTHDLDGPYAGPGSGSIAGYTWAHSLGEILTSVIRAGLRPEFLHEYPSAWFPMLPYLERRADGRYWLPARIEGECPLLFTLRATAPGAPA